MASAPAPRATTPPRPRQPGADARARNRERHSAHIVDVAIGLFDRHGIDATSMEDIARAAGVSRATVFNHFPYKEALLVEIGARLVLEIAARMGSQRRRSARRALQDLADAVATIAEQHPTVAAYIVREMTHPEPERRQFAASRMQYPALYQALLAELAANGRLRSPARLRAYERILVDLTTGALVRAGNDIPIDRLRAELRANVDVFWEGAVTPDR